MDEFTEWKCKSCGFFVWRYTLVKEKRASRIEFPHSKIHPDGDDAPCGQWLFRTGRTREGYVDEVFSPDGEGKHRHIRSKVDHERYIRICDLEAQGVR